MCPKGIDLSAYFDGELSADKNQAIGLHVQECAVCKGKIDQLKERQKSVIPFAEHDVLDGWNIDRLWQYRTSARRILDPPRGFISMSVASVAMIVVALVLLMSTNIYSIFRINNMIKPTQVNMMLSNIAPDDIDEFLIFLESSQGFPDDSIHAIPVDFPVERFGHPQFALDKPQWKKP